MGSNFPGQTIGIEEPIATSPAIVAANVDELRTYSRANLE
jgi:hypothetical protein